MNDTNEKLWRRPPDRGGKRSGLDPTIIRTVKRLHARGRTNEEIALGLDLDEQEVEIALAGGVTPRRAKEGEK